MPNTPFNPHNHLWGFYAHFICKKVRFREIKLLTWPKFQEIKWQRQVWNPSSLIPKPALSTTPQSCLLARRIAPLILRLNPLFSYHPNPHTLLNSSESQEIPRSAWSDSLSLPKGRCWKNEGWEAHLSERGNSHQTETAEGWGCSSVV